MVGNTDGQDIIFLVLRRFSEITNNKPIFSQCNILTNTNIPFFNLPVDLISIIAKKVNQIMNNIHAWKCVSMYAYGGASLKLFPVVWIFLNSLSVISYNWLVFSECHKNYFNDWCLTDSQPTSLFLTYLNLMNYGHIIKSI